MEGVKATFLGAAEGTKAAFGAASSSPYLLPVVIAIAAVFLVVIIVYIVIQYRYQNPLMLNKGPIDLWAPGSKTFISRSDTAKNMKGTWTLSFYVRFDAVPDMRAATPFLTWPGNWAIHYNPAQEELVWVVAPAPDGSFGARTQNIPIPNVPLQRWTQVSLVAEGRSLDMYVNGQLVKSDQLTNLPQSGAGSVIIVPNNIMGQAAYVQLWPRRLTGAELTDNYGDTSDSQGRPLLGPAILQSISGLSIPNLFCAGGNCAGSSPSAQPSQTWEFPYA
jgi:hypothetical protein